MMDVVLALGSSLAALLVVTPNAHAEPPPVSTSEPSYYVQGSFGGGGLYRGSERGAQYAEATIESGVRLGDGPLWVRGMAGLGGASNLEGTDESGAYLELRAGLEARRCTPSADVCFFGGVDLGRRAIDPTPDTPGNLDNGGDSTGAELPSSTAFEVVPRAGLDLGGPHLRLRAALEAPVASDGDGIAVSAGVAYEW